MFLCGFDRCLPCDKIYTWKPNTSIIKLKHTHFDKLSPQGCVGYKWRYDSFIDEECMNKFPSSKWNRSISLLVLHQSLIWCHLPNPPFALLHHISHTSMECAFVVDVTHIGHICFLLDFVAVWALQTISSLQYDQNFYTFTKECNRRIYSPFVLFNVDVFLCSILPQYLIYTRPFTCALSTERDTRQKLEGFLIDNVYDIARAHTFRCMLLSP